MTVPPPQPTVRFPPSPFLALFSLNPFPPISRAIDFRFIELFDKKRIASINPAIHCPPRFSDFLSAPNFYPYSAIYTAANLFILGEIAPLPPVFPPTGSSLAFGSQIEYRFFDELPPAASFLLWIFGSNFDPEKAAKILVFFPRSRQETLLELVFIAFMSTHPRAPFKPRKDVNNSDD